MHRNRFLWSAILCLVAIFNVWADEKVDAFFSTLDNLVPVQVRSNRNANYVIKMNASADYVGKAVNSGTCGYTANELWYLVGTVDSFKMYSYVAGASLALTLDGVNEGAAATLTPEGTVLCLVSQGEDGYAITPKNNVAQSFNMYGGNGQDVKLYSAMDAGSKWNFKRIDTNRSLTLNYKMLIDKGSIENVKIGEVAIIVDGVAGTTMLTRSNLPESTTCYLPEGAVFSVGTGMVCHGWTIEVDGIGGVTPCVIPVDGLSVNINISTDQESKYQYLYHTPDPEGKPYRIPAIAAAPNGTIFAIADNRPCGMDIGYGEVDIKCRISNDNGLTWGEEFFVADGKGGKVNEMTTGYGDAAIVADREKNRLLVMMVCGRTVCWNGRWTPEKNATDDAVNRVARVYATYNKKSKAWEWTQPEEVTNEIYQLFLKEGKPTVSSMFIGSGRIAQSSKVKVGEYYRLYCAIWTRDEGNRVLYSDDLGETWNILGTVDDRPAPYGDEPKCEELSDGSVLLSSRKGYGRYFNVYKYDNVEKAEGEWQEVVATDQVGDLKWGSNSTNGELLRVGNVLFQSAPTGNGRTDVSLFYKVLGRDSKEYTPIKLSEGWTKIPVSTVSSAYSSMCILPDGNIGMLYEEAPGDYSIVYVPIVLSEILPVDVYKETLVRNFRKGRK